MKNYKQLIIARKDLNMSPGKLAAQVSHGSMAWLTNAIKRNAIPLWENLGPWDPIPETRPDYYHTTLELDPDIYEGWIEGSFTKVVCEARNRNQLMRAATIAEELGLRPEVDFFFIRDNCLTELEPEEVDENGIGRTLTVVGFRPLPADVCEKISRKFQLYK